MNDLSVAVARAKRACVAAGAGWGLFVMFHLADHCLKRHHQGNTPA